MDSLTAYNPYGFGFFLLKEQGYWFAILLLLTFFRRRFFIKKETLLMESLLCIANRQGRMTYAPEKRRACQFIRRTVSVGEIGCRGLPALVSLGVCLGRPITIR